MGWMKHHCCRAEQGMTEGTGAKELAELPGEVSCASSPRSPGFDECQPDNV